MANAIPAPPYRRRRQGDEDRCRRRGGIARKTELDRIDRHAPPSRRREGRIGLGRPVAQHDARKRPTLVAEGDRQLFRSAKRTLGESAKRPLLAARRLDDPKHLLPVQEREPGWPAKGVVERSDLDPDSGTRRKLQRQPAMPANLEVTKRIEV